MKTECWITKLDSGSRHLRFIHGKGVGDKIVMLTKEQFDALLKEISVNQMENRET